MLFSLGTTSQPSSFHFKPFILLRILWVKTSPLHPLTRGGDLRTFNILKQLHRRHDITFVGMVADAGQVAGSNQAHQYSNRAIWVKEPKASLKLSRAYFLAGAAANIISKLPYAVERFRSDALCAKVSELAERHDFDVMVCDFLFPAASLPWDTKVKSSFPWVLFQHNVESMIWQRRSSEKKGLARIYLRWQWQRMLKFETAISKRFDGVMSVSEEDTSIFREQMRLPNVLGSVPTGVDLEFFQAVPKTCEAQPTVIFMGSMDWYANIDAVGWFAAAVWPRIRAKVPGVKFIIVGRQPPPSICALASESAQIEVTGTVPDVRPYLRSAQAMVVPLRIGGGTRIKIFEAMAAEVPVVSTTIGAEGLQVVHGRHALIADEAIDFADAVVSLLCQPDLSFRISRSALDEVALPNSWDAAARIMEQYLLQLINQEATPKPASE